MLVQFVNVLLSYLLLVVIFVAVGGCAVAIGMFLRKRKNKKQEKSAEAEAAKDAEAAKIEEAAEK